MKRILFAHYRTGERDGVGLEIEKRAEVLRELGHKVYYLTGFEAEGRKNAFVISEIDMKSNFSKFMREDAFYEKLLDEKLAIALYYQREAEIYKKIKLIFKKIKPDLVFVHNLFSHAYNLPATTALVSVLDKYETPTVAVNHDFWFEREQFLNSKHPFIAEILTRLPPNRPYIIKHQVINSIAQKELKARKRIVAERIGDFFDFGQPIPQTDSYNSDLPKYFKIGENDLVILHATRITARKAIENALIFARILERKLRNKAPIKVNDKLFKRSSRVVILFPNFVEVDALDYFKKLKLLTEKLGVNAVWGFENFLPKRQKINGIKKYSFWDSYIIADLVTYTSTWEGFGNQFLEAVFFKKLPVIFKYRVFKADISKEGYKIVSLGDRTFGRGGFNFVKRSKIEQAVKKTIETLTNKSKLEEIVEGNFAIGKRNHDSKLLKKDLKSLLAVL